MSTPIDRPGGPGLAVASSSASRSRRRRAGSCGPASSIQVVASSSMVTSTHSPGTSAAGSGDAAERIGRPHVAVRQVEHAAGDERGRAVGEDVAQLDGEVARPGPTTAGADSRTAGRSLARIEAFADRPVVDQRAGVVGALVGRLPPRQRTGARVPRGHADVADDGEHVDAAVAAARRMTTRSRRAAASWAVGSPLPAWIGEVGLRVRSAGARTPGSATAGRRRSAAQCCRRRR